MSWFCVKDVDEDDLHLCVYVCVCAMHTRLVTYLMHSGNAERNAINGVSVSGCASAKIHACTVDGCSNAGARTMGNASVEVCLCFDVCVRLRGRMRVFDCRVLHERQKGNRHLGSHDTIISSPAVLLHRHEKEWCDGCGSTVRHQLYSHSHLSLTFDFRCTNEIVKRRVKGAHVVSYAHIWHAVSHTRE